MKQYALRPKKMLYQHSLGEQSAHMSQTKSFRTTATTDIIIFPTFYTLSTKLSIIKSLNSELFSDSDDFIINAFSNSMILNPDNLHIIFYHLVKPSNINRLSFFYFSKVFISPNLVFKILLHLLKLFIQLLLQFFLFHSI